MDSLDTMLVSHFGRLPFKDSSTRRPCPRSSSRGANLREEARQAGGALLARRQSSWNSLRSRGLERKKTYWRNPSEPGATESRMMVELRIAPSSGGSQRAAPPSGPRPAAWRFRPWSSTRGPKSTGVRLQFRPRRASRLQRLTFWLTSRDCLDSVQAQDTDKARNGRSPKPEDKSRQAQSASPGAYHRLRHFCLDIASASGARKAAAAIPPQE